MNVEELEALRQRVRAAAGADRELDSRIDACLFGGRAAVDFNEGTPNARLRKSYGAGTVFDHTDPDTNGGHVLTRMTRHSAEITASIDASLALEERVLPITWNQSRGLTTGFARDGEGQWWEYSIAQYGEPDEQPHIISAVSFKSGSFAIIDTILTALIEQQKTAAP